MLPELEALLQLQRYDAQLMEVQKKRDSIPVRKEALKTSLAAAKASVEHAKKDLEGIRLARRAQEKEIEVVTGEGVKLERQLLDVKTNQEYQAMLAQIATLKSKRSDRETVVLEHFEREEELVAAAKQAEAKIAEEERKLKAGEADLEKEAASLDQSIHSIQGDRDAVRPKVPAAILSRYDRLSKGRDGIAVSEVRKSACGACFKALTPQAVQEARRGDQMMTCEQCGRILIWTEGSAA